MEAVEKSIQSERALNVKKMECIIQPFKLEEVKEALKKIAVEGMTVTDEEEKVEEMINTIQSLAKTSKIGAGKIFVIPVEDVSSMLFSNWMFSVIHNVQSKVPTHMGAQDD